MITTSEPRRRRVFETAVAISLAVHLLVLLIYIGFFQRLILEQRRLQEKPDDFVALSDSIRLEKRTIPRPSVARRSQPPQPVRPQPVAAAPPQARPVPLDTPVPLATPAERRELARIVPNAAPRARAAPKSVAAADLPHRTESTTTSTGRITALDPQFEKVIAESNQSVRNFPVQNQPPSSIKPHQTQMLGFTQREIQDAQGDTIHYEPCPGIRHCYYLRVNYYFKDGTIETISFPWPWHFTDRFDPFETGAPAGYYRFPFQMPPAGFAPPHPFYVSRVLCYVFEAECKAVLDAEARNGGRPAQ